MNETTKTRDRGNGQYAHATDRPCRCGHSLGKHTAAVVKGQRPCLHDGCECEKYKPAKK